MKQAVMVLTDMCLLVISNEMVDHTRGPQSMHGKRKMFDYQVKVEIQSNQVKPGDYTGR